MYLHIVLFFFILHFLNITFILIFKIPFQLRLTSDGLTGIQNTLKNYQICQKLG